MKAGKFLIVTAVALLTGSCSKTPPRAEPAPTPTPSSTAPASATPTPVAVTTPTPPPPGPHFAPPGVYFAIQRISLRTADGIQGFPPGTRLVLMKNMGDRFRVMSGGFQFEVAPSEVTNDMDFAALAARQDAQAQQALAAYMQQQQAVADRAEALAVHHFPEPGAIAMATPVPNWLHESPKDKPRSLEQGAYNKDRSSYYPRYYYDSGSGNWVDYNGRRRTY